MNVVILIGRLTKDAEIKTSGDKSFAKFSLAVSRFKKDETDFINCTAFGKTAEILEKYTHKGSKVGIRGRIQTGSYTNREGQKVYTTDVVVDDLELLDSKKDSEQTEKVQDDGEFMKFDATQESLLPF